MDKLTSEVVPILVLCAVIAMVVRRLPKIDVGHSAAYRRRRVLNWLPLGLTYAVLYMGRYNLNALLNSHELSAADFGDIDALGSIIYGCAFFLNGPLTDRFGGRKAILVAAVGAGVCNALIGLMYGASGHPPSKNVLLLLFGLNMYFQSFGAVAIVKVNAAWFHLRERGTFGGIFGILISLGLYLAFDWAPKIAAMTSPEWLFLSPAVILAVFFVLDFMFVRDTPGDAGYVDFDVADASSGDDGPRERWYVVIWRMLSSKILMTIAIISLASGFLRNGILKWFREFAKGVGANHTFLYDHWGMMSCIAGITGGVFAGVISDHLFHSRRLPVSSVLFAIVLTGSVAMVPLIAYGNIITWFVAFMMMAIIGVNGMLSGVASQDFGGKRNAGTATGLIDGFVYFGTAIQGEVFGHVLPHGDAATKASNWSSWPVVMIPMAVIGLGLSITLWNARVQPKLATAGH